jgi:CHAT domain-containing protein/Tfp pilus assembly protein PilF
MHFNPKIITLVFLLTSTCPLLAQNVKQDTLFSQMYRKLVAMNSEGQFSEVITEGEAFLANLQTPDSSLLSYGNLLNVIGTGHYNYGTGDKAFWYTERALAIFTKLDHIRMADAYDRLGECHYWYTQDYDKAIGNCQKALAIHRGKSKGCTPQMSSIYANLGMIYTAQLNYSEAEANYKKALDCQNNDYDLGKLYVPFGDFYLKQSLYGKALAYFSKAEFHFKQFYKENKNHPNIATAYANQAICYRNMGAGAKAITYFNKAKQIFDEKLGKNHPNVLLIQSNIGFCYSQQEQYEDVIRTLKPLIEVKNLEERDGFRANILDKLGYAYAMKKQWIAFDTIMNQLVKDVEIVPFTNLLDKITIYRNIGLNYRIANKYKESSIFYQKALKLTDSLEVKDESSINLIYLDLGYNAISGKKADEAVQYFEKILNESSDKDDQKSLEYYHTIYGLSLAYYLKFEATNSKAFLEKAIERMEAAVNIVLNIRDDYIEQADKKFINNDANTVFNKLIGMFFQKNELSPDSNIFKKCFILSEQGKSMRLLEAIKGIEIGKNSIIVDNIRAVKQTINTLENRIDLAIKDTTENLLKYWQSQLFEANQEQERLVNDLKTNAEQNFKDLYQPKILAIEEVQQLITNDQTVLEYTVGDSSIHIFTINKNNYKVTEVKKDFPLDAWIQQMRTGIYGSFLNKMRDDSLTLRTMSYVDAATQLYDKIVAPVKPILRGSVIIIPDGVLGYVPFDALLIEKPNNIARPQLFNYLLNKHKISYCYSATLLNEMLKKEHRQPPKEPFLAMMPIFNDNKNSESLTKKVFDPLPYSMEEVVTLHQMMNGDTLIGKKETKDIFIQKASNYRIIHLSTHGKMDDKIGDYAYLAFAQSPNSTENELLYTRELYNIQLNADMVVLSACETGIGELQRGEGIISLARAFAFAGSKSIVTTIWTVNDRATKELMVLFYKNLKDGKSKDEALWLAKRTYISNNKGESALPFFWSGIIPIGDMRPIGKY